MITHQIVDEENNVIFTGSYSQCNSRIDKTGAGERIIEIYDVDVFGRMGSIFNPYHSFGDYTDRTDNPYDYAPHQQ